MQDLSDTLHLNRMLRLFGEKMSGVVAFGYPLATQNKKNPIFANKGI